MEYIAQSIRHALFALVMLALSVTAVADQHEEQPGGGRAVAIALESEVVDVDVKNRQISLKSPVGSIVTLTIREEVASLENIEVGDTVVTTYIAALESDLRPPTEEELAEPWLVIEEGGPMGDHAIGGARIIRAVCTIEGMNRALRTVTLKDSNGKLHLIGDVEPEKMEGVSLGQTIVVVYSEALALTLQEKVSVE